MAQREIAHAQSNGTILLQGATPGDTVLDPAGWPKSIAIVQVGLNGAPTGLYEVGTWSRSGNVLTRQGTVYSSRIDSQLFWGTFPLVVFPFVAGSYATDAQRFAGFVAVAQGILGTSGGGGAVTDGVYGDITVTASGTTWTINNGTVGLSKLSGVSPFSLGLLPLTSASTWRDGLGLGVTGVTAGSYTNANITVDALGRVTAAANGSSSSGIDQLTGDVTAGPGSGSQAATIAAGVVSLAKMADLATARFIGRVTAGTGVPEALTGTQATTLLDVFASGLKGLAPASGGGTTNFLRADGTWAAPPDTGITQLTGHVTAGPGSGSQAATIAAGVVANSMLANMTGPAFKGRTSGTGAPTDLTSAQATTIIDVFSTSLKGLAPASGGGTTNFLRADGTWAAPPDTGITQLTGDVTAGPGSGSQAATIAAGVVTLAKMANLATARFIGRVTAGTGVPEALTGTQATTLLDTFTTALKGLAPASGGGTTNFLRADGTWAAPPDTGITQLTGHVTAGPGSGSQATTIAAGVVAMSMLANLAGLSVIGRSANTLGVPAAITGTADQVLRVSGSTLGFGDVAQVSVTNLVSDLAARALTTTDMIAGNGLTGGGTLAASRTFNVVGNADGSIVANANDIQVGVLATDAQHGVRGGGTTHATFTNAVSGFAPASGGGTTNFLRADGTWAAPPDTGITQLTGDVTAGPGSGSQAATIAAGAVSLAKMANIATARFIGRVTAGTGVPEALTGTQATTLLDTFTTALKGLAPASGGGTTNFLRADGTWAAPPDTGITQLTGHVTAGPGSGSQAATIAAGVVALSMLANLTALSVIGNATNASATPTAITGTADQVLRVSGTTLGFGQIATAGITDAAVTVAKLANLAGLSIIGRSANTTGVPAAITGTAGQVLRVSGTTLGFGDVAQANVTNLVTDLAARVVGPASATDNAIARFDLTTGKIIQNSGVTLNDTEDFTWSAGHLIQVSVGSAMRITSANALALTATTTNCSIVAATTFGATANTNYTMLLSNSGFQVSDPTLLLDVNATTNQVKVPPGTAAAPGRVHIGDDASGEYTVAANHLGWSTNGTGKMSLDSSGRLAVGNAAIGVASAGVDIRPASAIIGLNVATTAAPWANFVATVAASSYMTFLQPASASAAGYLGLGGGGAVSAGSGADLALRAENDLYISIANAESIHLDATYAEFSVAVAYNPGSTVSLTADNQAVTVGGRSYLKLSSNDAVSTNRTFTLSSGVITGAVLVIQCIANACELADSGNCVLAGTWTAGSNDTLSLIWDGTSWVETARSNN